MLDDLDLPEEAEKEETEKEEAEKEEEEKEEEEKGKIITVSFEHCHEGRRLNQTQSVERNERTNHISCVTFGDCTCYVKY